MLNHVPIKQAFTYNTFSTGANGPFVFVALAGYINNGVGPGQICLTIINGRLEKALCDPLDALPEQQFFVGKL